MPIDPPPVGHRFPDDESVMRCALQLAQAGRGFVEPNPMVGAVIVDEERSVVATGWHRSFGEDHAEVEAIRSAAITQGMRLFVTLEPCSHHGKTPPCADAVVRAGFHDVVVGCEDPAPHGRGNGIARMRSAGLTVSVGLCGEQARKLIEPFAMLHTQGRPWVHAKWAMTLDGRIATSAGHSRWISSRRSREAVHDLRGVVDAIITGAGTVRADDPLLTARPPGPRTAVRIVVDSRGTSVHAESRLAATIHVAPLIIATTEPVADDTRRRLRSVGAEVFGFPQTESGKVCLRSLLEELGRRRMTHVLLEAGSGLTGSFFDAGLIDEVHVFVAPKLAGGVSAFSPVGGHGRRCIPQSSDLADTDIRVIGDDVLIHGRVCR